MTPLATRRAVLCGSAALALAGALPRLALAQPGPARLKAARAERFELAGREPLALFNDSLPGPMLKAKVGQPFSVTVENGLSEAFALTWHGVRGPSSLSGLPGLSGPGIAPGESRDYAFTPRDSGTFWYHATAPGLSRRALCGGFVVEDAMPSGFAADHLLFIQTFPPESGSPIFPVNGAISPTFQAPMGGRARMRLVNATQIFLGVRVKGAKTYMVAVDGQPSEPFELKDNRTLMAPGGRVDLAVDVMTPDAVVFELISGQAPLQLAILVPVGAVTTPVAGPPAALPANDLAADIPLTGAARFEVPLDGTFTSLENLASIGSVKKGASVVLTLVNAQDGPVAVHIHGHPVRQLDGLDDGWKPWWHDTIPVPPRATVRVAFRADTVGTWGIIGMRDQTVVAARSYDVTA